MLNETEKKILQTEKKTTSNTQYLVHSNSCGCQTEAFEFTERATYLSSPLCRMKINRCETMNTLKFITIYDWFFFIRCVSGHCYLRCLLPRQFWFMSFILFLVVQSMSTENNVERCTGCTKTVVPIQQDVVYTTIYILINQNSLLFVSPSKHDRLAAGNNQKKSVHAKWILHLYWQLCFVLSIISQK